MLGRIVDYSIFIILSINIYVWGSGLDWRLDEVGLIQLFPLLGLIAFSTMWWHFLAAFIRRIRPDISSKNQRLHRLSAYWVFVAFMLHPALLALWGLQNLELTPVDTFRAYVGSSNLIYLLLGYIGLAGFITYDVGRLLAKKSWVQRNRHMIIAASDLSFVLILIHSLNLGQHLQHGWFRIYWILLGLSGIGFILYRYYYQYRHGSSTKVTDKQ